MSQITKENLKKKEEARYLRKTTDLTVEQIAKQIGTNPLTTYAWCKGVRLSQRAEKLVNNCLSLPGKKFGNLTILEYEISKKYAHLKSKCCCPGCLKEFMANYNLLQKQQARPKSTLWNT